MNIPSNSIPIENIYYLLCYAWDKLEEKEVVNVAAIESTTLADLFARVLISGSHHLVKRGLDRTYVPEQDWTSRLRGRVNFNEVVRHQATRRSALPCAFDEFSYDILHNQILKATFRRLLCLPKLDGENALGLAHLIRLLSGVSDIELSARVFSQVQLHRNNQFYDFMLKVCELIYRNLLVSEIAGASKFADFTRDDQQMARLFETFVRNFYHRETGYSVKRENLYWRWQAEDSAAHALLPRMQTDVSLTRAGRKIIMECKYTADALSHHYDADKLHSSHLYQLNAYMANLPDDALSSGCEMILLYPAVKASFSRFYRWREHSIRVHTLNLDQPWVALRDELLILVG